MINEAACAPTKDAFAYDRSVSPVNPDMVAAFSPGARRYLYRAAGNDFLDLRLDAA